MVGLAHDHRPEVWSPIGTSLTAAPVGPLFPSKQFPCFTNAASAISAVECPGPTLLSRTLLSWASHCDAPGSVSG